MILQVPNGQSNKYLVSLHLHSTSLFLFSVSFVRFELITANEKKLRNCTHIRRHWPDGSTPLARAHRISDILARLRSGEASDPAEELPADARGKLEQKVIDFERLDEAWLRDGNWDAVFITCVLFFTSWYFLLTNGPLHVGWERASNLRILKQISRKLTRSTFRPFSGISESLTPCPAQVCSQHSESCRGRKGPAIEKLQSHRVLYYY